MTEYFAVFLTESARVAKQKRVKFCLHRTKFCILEVLQTQLAKYKSAFEMVVREARKLDVAIGKHLSQEAENIPGKLCHISIIGDLIGDSSLRGAGTEGYQKFLACPSCGRDVILRQKASQDSDQSIMTTQSSSNRLIETIKLNHFLLK